RKTKPPVGFLGDRYKHVNVRTSPVGVEQCPPENMSSIDSILGLKSKATLQEDVDFTLQKERIEEAFEELLNDLEAFARVEAHLKKQPNEGETVWKDLYGYAKDHEQYTKFQHLLRALDIKAKGVECGADDPITQLVGEAVRNIRAISDKSLLRPPSPRITIKNRAEYETFRWSRMIALQESKLESLQRKIEEYERKVIERIAQRQRLHQRSASEKQDLMSASQNILVDMKLEGDGMVQRLKEQLASQPHFENTPDYLSLLDKHELKKKRIAKMEVQLQLWIKKYDKFIGEPMPSLLALEEKMGGLEEWRDTVLRPQEERLHQLRDQIGVFESIALEEKIEQMRKMHAVRVLQRAWKRTLEIKRAKKGNKSKKGKGKNFEAVCAGDTEEDVAAVRAMVEKITSEIMAHGEEEYDSYDTESLQKVEFNIQINRVGMILGEMTQTLEVLFCLPIICQNEAILDVCFDVDDKNVIKFLSQYIASNTTVAMSKDDIDVEQLKIPSGQLIELASLLSKKELHAATVGHVKQLPGVYRRFLSNIREFRKFTINKMKLTAQKDLAKEKILHRLWTRNERNKKEIRKIEDILVMKKEKLEESVQEKFSVIERYRKELEELGYKSRENILKFMDDSDREMYHFFERSDQRYENLLEEAACTLKSYQQQLQADLTVEKTNRLKKLKLTNQLQMWLHKYDKDAGERTHELKGLVAKLNTRQQEYNRWKRNIFDPQEKKYFDAMEEKRQIEIREQEERIEAFMMNRAAKVLQRAWRSVAERKRKMRGKGRGRKGKGKRK
uniref:Dynein regulatory complex protein 10 n=1 Tax=Anopheles christyi TaxID=43041 RepID=A0A182JZ04_9DIPT